MKKSLKLNLFGKKSSFDTITLLVGLFLGMLIFTTFLSKGSSNKSISHAFTEKMRAETNAHIADAHAYAANASYELSKRGFSKNHHLKNNFDTKIFGKPFTMEGLQCGKHRCKDGKCKDKVESFTMEGLQCGKHRCKDGKCKNGEEGFRNMDEPDMDGVEGNYVSSLTYDIGDSINHSDTYNKVTLPIKSLGGFFDENKFSKNCRSMYSNSMGMACITKEQLEHLDHHGGNRTMGDE